MPGETEVTRIAPPPGAGLPARAHCYRGRKRACPSRIQERLPKDGAVGNVMDAGKLPPAVGFRGAVTVTAALLAACTVRFVKLQEAGVMPLVEAVR